MAGSAVAQRLCFQLHAGVVEGSDGAQAGSGGARFNPLFADSKKGFGARRTAATAVCKRIVPMGSADGAELRTAGLGNAVCVMNLRQHVRSLVARSAASGSLGAAAGESLGLQEGDGGNGLGGLGGSGGGGGGGDSGNGRGRADGDGKREDGGIVAAILRGWRERVKADPQFPFKVLTEEVIGVGACVLGDMASRPNFGLDELDFVFSTVVVGMILNFTLMYMLAPTSLVGAAVSSRLPGFFASCPPGHMFEAGAYSFVDRLGTFIYKGMQFAAVGFVAGLAGTALSNTLLDIRKRLDPNFVPQNESPPTILNAATWAGHMGLSSNLRYQAVNGVEFALAGVMTPGLFKSSVFIIRAVNNVLGGTSFVYLARLTGSQKSGVDDNSSPPQVVEDDSKNVEAVGAS